MDTIDQPVPEPGPALPLPAVLDMRAAAPLAAELLERRGRDIELDASAVQRLGGQCLQVLLAARAAWNADGCGFRIASPSSGFTEGLVLLGAPAFADPSRA